MKIKKSRFKYNSENPPLYNELTVEEFNKQVDLKSFPTCDVCANEILNPDYYDIGMCGLCTTGESAEVMRHSDEFDDRPGVFGFHAKGYIEKNGILYKPRRKKK